MTVGGLIQKLIVFADFYERASADIDREEGVTKSWYIGKRDANADVMQRDFRATVATDRVRAYVLSKYGADLTIGTARRLLGDLIQTCALSVDAAEALPLEVAMDKLANPPALVHSPTDVARNKPNLISDFNRGLQAQGDADTSEKQDDPAPTATIKPTPKRSTERGEGRAKLISALTKHHRYADGGCLNLEPVGNNALAKVARVSASTASAFFNDKFQGHTKYKALCRDAGRLAAALKLLNHEFAPYHLLGAASSDLAAPEEEDTEAE
jgi:hypothetical protein